MGIFPYFRFINNRSLIEIVFIVFTSVNFNSWMSHAESISGKSIAFTGLIIDKPKIRVLSYRIRNDNPNSITEELSCVEPNGAKNCDELIKVNDDKKFRLGQDGDELKEWSSPPNMTQLTLQCSSKSGPVEWDYQGKGKFPDLKISTRRITGDFWSPTTYVHYSDITFTKITDQLTGTFVCRSVEKPSLTNSFYMFVPQERLSILDRQRVIVVTPSIHTNSIVIPCRIEERESSVHLYKKMEDGSLKRMNMDSSLSLKFNPFVGFELKLSPEVYGHYVCKVDKKEKKEEDDDEPDSRKFRVKRDIIETSTSPGFSAFPTSDELAESESEFDFLNPKETDHISVTYSDSEIERRNRLRGKWRKGQSKKKRPVFLHRRRVGANQFSRRGGPHNVGGQHINGNGGGGHYLRLRPKPMMGPFRRVPQFSPYRPYHPMRAPIFAVPVSIVHDESDLKTTVKNASSSESSGEVSNKDYFWPPLSPIQHYDQQHQVPPHSFPPPQYPNLNRIKVLPALIKNVNKLGQRLRPTIRPFAPTSSEESAEAHLKQSEKDASAELPGASSTSYSHQNQRTNSTTSHGKDKPLRRRPGAAALLSPNLLPQTMNIMNSMGCVLKKVMLGPDASCNGSFFEAGAAAAAAANSALSRRPQTTTMLLGGRPEDQETILEVIVEPRPNKFFPPDSTIYTTVPFFVKWQTKSTDYSNWAEVNHTLAPGTWKLHKAGHFQDHGVHSFEVFNLRDGDSGKISVPYVGINNKILVHTWKFFVITDTAFTEKGLKQREEGSKNIFNCKSATANKPKISLTKLSDDGCPIEGENYGADKKRKGSKKKSLVEEDCGLGCISIRTDIESGIVHCIGDGVDETLRYPVDTYCTGRPFFVERGKTKNLTLSQNKKKLNIPCVINNPNADVYLFHQNPNGTISDVTDYTTYDLKLGFSLNLEEITEPLGTYACTSNTNVEDDSDMVTYHVNPAPDHVFNPPQETVYGSPPFRFVWESVEELEVENKSAGNFYSGVFAKPEGNRAFVGTFEIASLERGGSGIINIVRSKDKQIVHTWRYAYQGKYGLWVDRKLNIFKCSSPTAKAAPSLFAVECSNPNVCRLKKRFIEDDGESHTKDPADSTNNLATVPVQCGERCTELKVWKDKPYGFVKCQDKGESEGMDESLTYFLSQNSTLLTESDDLEPFRTVEISSMVRTLHVGDRITFVCRANMYFYSHGFQWAIEMKNGSKRFLDPSVSQEIDISTPSTDSSSAEQQLIRAQVHLTVGDKDWKAVWCYVPSLSSNQWGNASQLVYIH